jgi:hypothetical protein
MKTLEVNVRKIMLMYGVGFMTAFLLPRKFFFAIMNYQHERVCDSIVVTERERYVKIE